MSQQLPQSEYINRRQALAKKLPAGAVAIIAAAPTMVRNGDVDHAYRQDSQFYYMTGFAEPESVLLLRTAKDGSGDMESLVLCRQRDPAKEVWDGRRLGVEAAPEALQVNTARAIDELDVVLDEWLDGAEYAYYALVRDDLSTWVGGSCQRLRAKQRQGAKAPSCLADVDEVINEMRLLKSPAEVAQMRVACDISARAHQHLMRTSHPGMMEYQLESHFAHACSMEGSQRLAYGTIVAGGDNANILHYVDNDQALNDGDLVLIDAGCELDYYAADITRTFPVNGRFSAPQRKLYDIVVNALDAAIAVVKDGVPVNALQQAAVQVITQGLVDLGILKGDVEELIKDEAYKPFYLHGVGHWLGMDVHDVGQYKIDGDWRQLRAGMVTTVEPGIYIAADTVGVDEQWLGIGIRVEDNILVTQDGHENMTRHVPVQADEIESLMQSTN